MKKKLIVLILLCLALLPACMPRSVAQLKADNPEPYRFMVDKGYQPVYRDLMDYFDRCDRSSGLALASFITQGNLYTDTATGEITLTFINLGNKTIWAYVMIRDMEGGTEVSVYAIGAWKDYGKLIEAGKCDKL